MSHQKKDLQESKTRVSLSFSSFPCKVILLAEPLLSQPCGREAKALPVTPATQVFLPPVPFSFLRRSKDTSWATRPSRLSSQSPPVPLNVSPCNGHTNPGAPTGTLHLPSSLLWVIGGQQGECANLELSTSPEPPKPSTKPPKPSTKPPDPSCRAALQLLVPLSVGTSRITLSQEQNPAFVLVRFHVLGDTLKSTKISFPLLSRDSGSPPDLGSPEANFLKCVQVQICKRVVPKPQHQQADVPPWSGAAL